LESVIRLVLGGSCLLLNLVFCDAADGGGEVYGEQMYMENMVFVILI